MEITQVGLMDCGDGYRRHDNGCLGKGPKAKTADYTIKALETGTIFTNAGATGPVIFTLPTPAAGMWFMFVKATPAQNLVIQAPSGVSINGGTAAQVYKDTTTESGTCSLVAIDTTNYVVEGAQGTWANAAS